MNDKISFSLDLSDAKAGPPLMSGDIGYDEYAGTLSTLGYSNLSVIKEAPEDTFRYIRIHNLFTSKEGDGRGNRDAGGDPVRIKGDGSYFYDWTIIDRVCQEILDVGCVPFLELGFTPTPWSSIDEKHKIPHDELPTELQYKIKKTKGVPGSYPPKDHSLWKDLLDHFFIHIQKKFGEEARKWPCELWNEPDIGYFKGTLEEYCDLWKITYEATKEADMEIIGGPGIAHNLRFLKDFLNFCVENTCEPDFISYHVKGGNSKSMVANMLQMWSRLLTGRDQIPKSLNDMPIWITEFDPIVGCENGIIDGKMWAFHNKSYYASWLGKCCLLLAQAQQSIGWGESHPDPDIGELKVDAIFNDGHHITAEQSPFFGARCMSTPLWVEQQNGEKTIDPLEHFNEENKLKKDHPSLHAMFEDLKSRMYQPDELDKYTLKSLAKPIFRAFEYTRNLKGRYIPFYRPHDEIYGIIAIDGKNINVCTGIHHDERLLMNEATAVCEIELKLNKAFATKKGGFEIKKSARIDSHSCNPFKKWKDMGSPYEVSKVQWETLYNATIPKKAQVSDLMIDEEKISFSITLSGNSLNFLRFE